MLLLYNVREARLSSSSSPQSWLLVRRERSYVWRAAKDVVFAFLFPFFSSCLLTKAQGQRAARRKKVTEKENCPLPAASFLITAKQTVRPSSFFRIPPPFPPLPVEGWFLDDGDGQRNLVHFLRASWHRVLRRKPSMSNASTRTSLLPLSLMPS